ncbi:GRF zinc finger family protein [Rhynchospora pubera]|uniref:GRF zinc finger family protein n=1 Tax=Rhynchospora pubera TaxID=906938 RepID=A0AAV8GNW4_9POAL|nr:GRF zinc finger family protein [Rhynchospora pubera]
MHRRSSRSESVSHSASSSVGPRQSGSEGLPLVPCPDCGVIVKKHTSKTELNPNRDFYKCCNPHTRCKFWLWKNDYERHISKANAVIPSLDSEVLATLEAQLENLMDEFKRKLECDEQRIRELVASLDKIKLYNCISAIVIVTLLIVVIVLLK